MVPNPTQTLALSFYSSNDLSLEISVSSGSQFMVGFNPVIDVDAPPQEMETMVESPASPNGNGMSVHMRQSNRFKRFSAILSVSSMSLPYVLISSAFEMQAEAAAAAVDASDLTDYLPRRTSFSQNSSPAADHPSTTSGAAE